MKRLSVCIVGTIFALASLQGMTRIGEYDAPAIEVECSDVAAALYSVCLQLHRSDWEVRAKGVEGPSEYAIVVGLSGDAELALRIRLLDGVLSTEGTVLSAMMFNDEEARSYYESEVGPILRAILQEASL